MAATESTMLALGTSAPDFRLPDFDGKQVALADFRDAKGLLVAFICNHCPFVKHVRPELARFARDYQGKGIAVVAINSNDIQAYPQDGPRGMAEEARSAGYTFPYLFDADRKLVYRGQFDDSRPGRGTPTGADVRAACNALLSGDAISADQKPSIGCSIKWKR
jgi:peroxiredoxin